MQKRISWTLKIWLLCFVVMPNIIFAKSSKTDSTQIQYGFAVAGSISSPSERDYYTFFGNSGDVVFIRSTEGVPGFQLRVELFGPDGTSLSNKSSDGVTELRIVLAGSGNYIIFVRENGLATGSYAIFLQKLNGSSGAVALNYGESVSGQINPSGDVDTYTFAGYTGDEISLQAAESASNLEMTLELFAPDGRSLLLQTRQAFNEVQWTLEADGTYTLLVSDDFQFAPSGGQGRGNYNLRLELLNDVPQPPQILSVVLDSNQVALTWQPNLEHDLLMYRHSSKHNITGQCTT